MHFGVVSNENPKKIFEPNKIEAPGHQQPEQERHTAKKKWPASLTARERLGEMVAWHFHQVYWKIGRLWSPYLRQQKYVEAPTHLIKKKPIHYYNFREDEKAVGDITQESKIIHILYLDIFF